MSQLIRSSEVLAVVLVLMLLRALALKRVWLLLLLREAKHDFIDYLVGSVCC